MRDVYATDRADSSVGVLDRFRSARSGDVDGVDERPTTTAEGR
ncbi:hypothetical protein [Haloplanus sp.]|nr:hypothetical protein [Haloplanus sp.]